MSIKTLINQGITKNLNISILISFHDQKNREAFAIDIQIFIVFVTTIPKIEVEVASNLYSAEIHAKPSRENFRLFVNVFRHQLESRDNH